jgi:hypothetical protein
LRRRLRVRPLATTVGAAAVPIVYYAILARADQNWEVAQKSAHEIHPLWTVLLTLAPLAVPALLAYRIRPATFLDVAIRVWWPAGLAVFLLAQTPGATSALHALLGLSVPLAVLAVQGLRMSLGRVPAGIVAGGVVVVLAPPLIDRLDSAHEIVRESLGVRPDGSRVSARFIDPAERRALDWLRDDSREGGVMAPAYLGALVPGHTGRSTYVGNSYWSGGNVAFLFASGAVSSLLSGALSPQDSRALVRTSGARFIFAGCGRHVDLERRLAGDVTRARRFDCADVFVVD